MKEKDERLVISKEEAYQLLKKNKHRKDTKESLDEENFYFFNDIGYLFIDDFLEEAVLFKNKLVYLKLIATNDLSKMNELNLMKIFETSDTLISNLSSKIKIRITKNDKLSDLKKIDSLIYKKGFSNFDFTEDFDLYFAYFSKVISNEVKPISWSHSKENSYPSFKIEGVNRKKYELFAPFQKMIINQDETFSFYSLASYIIDPYIIPVKNRG